MSWLTGRRPWRPTGASDPTILDIRMPKMSGIAALRAIREADPSAAVVILTDFPEPQYRRRCMEAGAAAFLDKSTEFESLPGVFRGLEDTDGTSPLPPSSFPADSGESS